MLHKRERFKLDHYSHAEDEERTMDIDVTFNHTPPLIIRHKTLLAFHLTKRKVYCN